MVDLVRGSQSPERQLLRAGSSLSARRIPVSILRNEGEHGYRYPVPMRLQIKPQHFERQLFMPGLRRSSNWSGDPYRLLGALLHHLRKSILRFKE